MYRVHYFFNTYNDEGKMVSTRLSFKVTDAAGVKRLRDERHSIVCCASA
jgi:hypothetical protein